MEDARRLFAHETLASRVERLQDRMRRLGVEGSLIKQNADLFYFSGTMQDAYLFIPAEGEAVLMVRRNLARARAESSLENIRAIDGIMEIPRAIAEFGYTVSKSLGLELDVIPAGLYLLVRDVFPDVEMMDVSRAIREVRSRKSPQEVRWMRQAGEQLKKVVDEVPVFLRPGVTELKLASELECRLRRAGHQGFMRMRAWNQELFFGHVLSGPAGAETSYFRGATGGRGGTSAFPQGASGRTISLGDPISIDLGGCVNGYMIDQTRMFALGFLPDELRRAYDAVREIHYGLRERVREGETCGVIHAWACDQAASYGYAENFMGYGEAKMPFIGHGIGLEVDELPVISAGNRTVLESGMTFALEPKLIFPGVGHVGIEDTYVLGPDGIEPLTTSNDDLIIVKSV